MLRPTVHWGPGEHRVAAPKRAATIYISERNPVQNRSHILRFTPLLITAAVFAQPIHYQHGPINTTHSPWTQLGGDSSHTHTPRVIGSHLAPPDWTSTGDGSITLSFTPQAGIVADDQRVYAVGQDQGFVRHLSAFDQDTGELAWATEIPFAILDSWSTPTLDLQNNTIIAASGFSMVALDRFTGDQVWLTPMDRPIVNASPCITDDLGPSNRLFITDYTFGSATNGSLICINTDPNTPANPFDPGEIVWSTQLPGNCSGNTPAYSDGVVYVSTADNGTGGAGHLLAFDATSTTQPNPIWDTLNPVSLGFFGAVTHAEGFIYASSYNFQGTQRSANTIKLNAVTGALQWSIPTVRTDAAPIALPNQRVLISGGVPTSPSTLFTGSLPAIELIEDHGNNATLLWDSFESTHNDLNSSGTWDQGEPYLSIGGWGHQPIAIINGRTTKLLVATMNAPSGINPFSHASDLHTIDLSKLPTDPGFIISSQPNTGTSPAIIGSRIFSTADSGISAISLNRSAIVIPITQQIRAIVDRNAPIRTLRPKP